VAPRFPFFEADILLDDALHYVHRSTYERQKAWLGVEPRPQSPPPARSKRSIMTQTSRLWKDALLPYELDTKLRPY